MSNEDFNEPPHAPAGPTVEALTAKCQIIYILFLIPNPITWIVGVVLASQAKAFAPAALQTHFDYQIRTFWFGLIGYIVGILLMFLFIGIFVLIAIAVWSVLRSVKGMSLLHERQPIPDPKTMMV